MTKEEFILAADLYPQQLNVWVTETPPWTVQGITVPVQDVGAPTTNVEPLLQYLNYIILPTDESEVVTLEVTSRSLQFSAGYTYYYFDVVNQEISTLGNRRVVTGSVIFVPGLLESTFTQSPYNVLYGNVQTAQQSNYINQAGSNTRAYVQDSMQSDTGWTNARYGGSVTNASNYAGLTPGITGNSFQGTFYPSQVTDSEIIAIPATDSVYTTYFHTGKQSLPTYSVREVASSVLLSSLPTGSTSFQISLEEYSLNSYLIEVGDLIKIVTGSVPSGPFLLPAPEEVMKVVAIRTSTIPFDTTITVEVKRGWSNTTPYKFTYPSGQGIYKIEPVRTYEIQGNKIQGVTKGKIRVQYTSDILYVDTLGVVYTGSFS